MVIKNGAKLESNFKFKASNTAAFKGENENSVLSALTITNQKILRAEIDKINSRDDFADVYRLMARILDGSKNALIKAKIAKKPCKTAVVLMRFANALEKQSEFSKQGAFGSVVNNQTGASTAFDILNRRRVDWKKGSSTPVQDALKSRSAFLGSFSVADKMLSNKTKPLNDVKTKNNDGRVM